VRAVDGAGPGVARVTLSFAACEDVEVAPATYEVPVVVAPPTAKK
jgi:hypothetical protein